MSIITLDRPISTTPIDVSQLRRASRSIDPTLIAPCKENVEDDLYKEHDAEPIKSMDDIFAISHHLISQGRYRDNMLFIVGINFGLRVSDLRMLRFAHLINDNLTFRDRFAVFERKTRNTRKRKKNRYITINEAVIEAVTLYLQNTPNISLSDYLFVGNSNRNNKYEPLKVRSINRILSNIKEELNLNFRMSSHSLRKTFCYHQMVMSNNDGRKLLLLQKLLGHSSPAQTLDYIGITAEEIQEAYATLNLGSARYNYLAGNEIVELEEVV